MSTSDRKKKSQLPFGFARVSAFLICISARNGFAANGDHTSNRFKLDRSGLKTPLAQKGSTKTWLGLRVLQFMGPEVTGRECKLSKGWPRS